MSERISGVVIGSLWVAMLWIGSIESAVHSNRVDPQHPSEADGRPPQTETRQVESNSIAGKKKGNKKMHFGNFSVSLAVKDLKMSKAFYEKLDFQPIGGKLEQNYLIMQNGTTTIGLFQGMFENNILTFNPGWNHKTEKLNEFQDVRELQASLKERGIQPVTEAEPATKGPASFVIVDPDGNSILVDQHVPKPN